MHESYLHRGATAMLTKDNRVHMRTTHRQVALWRLTADEAGLSLSEWLRRVADQAARRELTST